MKRQLAEISEEDAAQRGLTPIDLSDTGLTLSEDGRLIALARTRDDPPRHDSTYEFDPNQDEIDMLPQGTGSYCHKVETEPIRQVATHYSIEWGPPIGGRMKGKVAKITFYE